MRRTLSRAGAQALAKLSIDSPQFSVSGAKDYQVTISAANARLGFDVCYNCVVERPQEAAVRKRWEA
jgi:hypothetical protein